ncbi:MAG: OmpA family protein [Candidatus Omnitrophota bacterium]
MKKWASVLFVAFLLAGCGSVPYKKPLVLSPVGPEKCEKVAINQAVIIVDSSRSMKSEEKIALARSLVESFVSAIPDGDFSTSLIVFGGDKLEVGTLKPFNRSELAAAAKDIPYLSGITPMEGAIKGAASVLQGRQGKTVVILFSDGLPTFAPGALKAMKELVKAGQGEVCIHAIQTEASRKGKEFLNKLVELSPCGEYRMGTDLYNEYTMVDFVRKIFIVSIPDSDGDDICDDADQCPDTPKGAKVDDRGCWTVPGVTFEYDKSVIRPQFFPELDDMANVLKENPGIKIYVDGHTCDIATEEYNQKLSERRADAVRSYFIEKGVEASRMTARGFGETKPIKPNTSDENRALNRRVELTIMK